MVYYITPVSISGIPRNIWRYVTPVSISGDIPRIPEIEGS
jgi:hypothetical protein